MAKLMVPRVLFYSDSGVNNPQQSMCSFVCVSEPALTINQTLPCLNMLSRFVSMYQKK